MAFIFQHPNGRYGRFSTICDCPSHINMTRDDYVQVVMERGLTREKAEEEVDDYLPETLTLSINDLNIVDAPVGRVFLCSNGSAAFRIVDMICDYLAACDLHYHSIAFENARCGVYLNFTFTESPTQ